MQRYEIIFDYASIFGSKGKELEIFKYLTNRIKKSLFYMLKFDFLLFKYFYNFIDIMMLL